MNEFPETNIYDSSILLSSDLAIACLWSVCFKILVMSCTMVVHDFMPLIPALKEVEAGGSL